MKIIYSQFLCLILLQCLFVKSAVSQDSLATKVESNVGIDFASQYVWRGLVLTEGPVIQSSAEITLKDWNFGLWGSVSFIARENKELDAYVGYNFKNFVFTVIDYFVYSDSLTPSYFNYQKENSAHTIEITGAFADMENFPFRFLAGVNVFGDSTNSTYFEAAWCNKLGQTDVELVAGYTPQTGYYDENKNGFTNVGANFHREITLNEQIALNLKFSVFYAPLIKQTHFAIIIGLY